MRLLLGVLLVAALQESTYMAWFEQAFYPALFLVFVIASLGIPIPEDVPLIAAGVILATSPGTASWSMALPVALAGIMSGDIILYNLGKRWGPDVFAHRSVRWLITPKRLGIMTERFHQHGMWMCFFGRFMVGVRAVMCLTAGVTRFPFWKFFLADFSGALLSAPFFMLLGYWFAGMIPTLQKYVAGAQWILFGVLGCFAILFVGHEIRRMRREAAQNNEPTEHAGPAAPSATIAAPPPPKMETTRSAVSSIPKSAAKAGAKA